MGIAGLIPLTIMSNSLKPLISKMPQAFAASAWHIESLGLTGGVQYSWFISAARTMNRAGGIVNIIAPRGLYGLDLGLRV